MATLEQIGRALRNAHNAGDTNAARRLAKAYKEMQAQQQTPQVSSAAQEAAVAVSQSPGQAAVEQVNSRFRPGGFLAGAGDAEDNAAARAIEGGIETAAQKVTGSDRREEGVPNLLNSGATFGLSPGQQAELAGSLMMANDQERQRRAVWNALPGARITQDESGFDIVEYEGQKAYINGPGLSQQDVAKGVVDAVTLLPVGRAYQGLRSLPAVGRVLGTLGLGGASGAALSAGQDVASNALGDNPTGSEDLTADVSGQRALLYGLGGAAGDAAVLGGNKLVRALSKGNEQIGRQAAQRMNIDYDALRPELKAEVNRIAAQAANPEDFARSIRALNLDAPIPLTRARALDPTNPKNQQQIRELGQAEVLAERAGLPEAAAARNEVQSALRDNAAILKTGNVDDAGLSVAEQGRRVSGRLTQMRQAEKDAVNNAYDTARAGLNDARRQGTEPRLPRKDAISAIRGVRARLREDGFTGTTAPAALREISRLVPPQQPGAKIKSVKLTRIQDAITRLNAMKTGTPTPETVAAGRASRYLQEELDDIVDQGLMDGSEDILSQFRQAAGMRRQFNRRWENKDILDELTRTKSGGSTELNVTPEKAVNYIFGTSSTGLKSKPELARNIKSLKARLGAGSQEWDAIRQGAVDKILNPAIRQSDFGDTISGVELRKSWEIMKRENPEVLREIFTPAQYRAMDEFVQVAEWATRQYQGTAHSAANMRAISSALGNSLFRMGTSGMGPRSLKYFGMLPMVGQMWDRIAQDRKIQQMLSTVPIQYLPAPLQARLAGVAVGAEAAGYDRQGE